MNKMVIKVSIFLVLLSLITMPIIENTKADINYSYGMENSYLDNQVSFAHSGFFQTEATHGKVWDTVYEGDRSYLVEDNDITYINYSSSITDRYILNWSIISQGWYDTQSNIFVIGFHDEAGTLLIHLEINIQPGSNLHFSYRDDGGANRELTKTMGAWDKIGFELLSNQTVRYYIQWLNNGTFYYLDDTFRNRVDEPKIQNISWFEKSGNGVSYMAFDLHNVTTSAIIDVEGGGTTPLGCGDFSDYEYFGTGFNKAVNRGIVVHDVLEIYQYERSCNITGFDLYVAQLTGSPEDYDLFIGNDIDKNTYIGSADCYFDYGSGYILRWVFDTPLVVNEEDIVAEILSNKGYTWDLYTFYSDDYPKFKTAMVGVHSTEDLIDGIFNGQFMDYTIAYRFYHGGIQDYTEDCNFNNAISLQGFLPNHNVFNLPYQKVGQEVAFFVTVNQTIPANWYLRIYREGTEIDEQFYPYDLLRCDKTYYFRPDQSGNYTVQIDNGANPTSSNFTFKHFYMEGSLTDNDFNLKFEPKPVTSGSYYYVTYDVNVAGDYYLALFYDLDNVNDFDKARDTTLLSGTDGIFEVDGSFTLGMNYHYWRYFKISGNYHLPVWRVYTQIIERTYIKPSLYVSPDNPCEGDIVIIGGYHTFDGVEVAIFSNNQQIIPNVPKSFVIDDYVFPYKGTYNVTLKVKIDGTFTFVPGAYELVTVIDCTQVPGEPGILPDIGELGPVVGIIVSVIFLFLPFGVGLSFNATANVPPIMYALSGSFGVVMSIYFGWFDIWVLFFIIVIAFVYFFGTMAYNKITGG